MKKCPFCLSDLDSSALKCKYCGERVVDRSENPFIKENDSKEKNKGKSSKKNELTKKVKQKTKIFDDNLEDEDIDNFDDDLIDNENLNDDNLLTEEDVDNIKSYDDEDDVEEDDDYKVVKYEKNGEIYAKVENKKSGLKNSELETNGDNSDNFYFNRLIIIIAIVIGIIVLFNIYSN